jgi:hypothetical protein
MQRILKVLAVAVALSFLGGAVLTASAASPAVDAGTPAPEPAYFPATKAAVMPRPRPRDAGQPVQPTYFPASKSFGGDALPGVKQQLNPAPQPPPQKQSPQQSPQQTAP